MRWKGRRQSSNVEDRRGSGGGRRTAFRGGIGTIIIIVLAILFGKNPMQLLQQFQGAGFQQAPPQTSAPSGADDELGAFIKTVFADNEDVWHSLFREMGKSYREPKLVLFESRVQSGCGGASSATGPFYCPADEKIYIDLSFYRELRDRFGAPGDFAMAYVLAHEVGHHVQNLLGISGQVDRQRGRVSKAEYNQLSVRLELQADFFAGVWANRGQKMKNFLDEGDIQEAIQAANAIGDDRLQKQAQGYVVPDNFTHGTSEQRVRWFSKGVKTGDLSQGDTFSTEYL